jgi:hypothetical protein
MKSGLARIGSDAASRLTCAALAALALATVGLGTDSFMADGDGKYDIRLRFPSGSGFDAGESVAYTITGIPSLTAASFLFLSAAAGGSGPFFSAAHVQNTTGPGSGDSGWIAAVVPLPPALPLLLGGLVALRLHAAFLRRRAPTRPSAANPDPSSQTAAGMGTCGTSGSGGR